MARTKNKIAPNNDEKALVAMDNQAAAIEKATKLYGDGEPFEVERILDCLVFKYGRISRDLTDVARYCLWLKEGIGWGGFSQALERRGIDRRSAYQAMLQYDRFGPNCATVAQLGVRKANAMTFFTKEEIERYVKGGDLRNIPHDDVMTMTALELEATVRQLRKKEATQKARYERNLEEKEAEIERLQNIVDQMPPLTEKEKAEKAAAVRLKPLLDELFGQLTGALAGLEGAMRAVVKAQAVEGATYPQLQEWARTHYHYLAPINNVYEELDQALNNCGPDRKDSDYGGM